MSKTRENAEFVQRSFQKIAVSLANAIPLEWSAIALGIFLTGNDNTLHIQLWAKFGKNGQYENLMKILWDDSTFLDATEYIQKICTELHTHCCSVHDDWHEFSFMLLPDGSYTADFKYESIPEITPYFVAEWQSRFLL